MESCEASCGCGVLEWCGDAIQLVDVTLKLVDPVFNPLEFCFGAPDVVETVRSLAKLVHSRIAIAVVFASASELSPFAILACPLLASRDNLTESAASVESNRGKGTIAASMPAMKVPPLAPMEKFNCPIEPSDEPC